MTQQVGALNIAVRDEGAYIRLVLSGRFPETLPEYVEAFARVTVTAKVGGHRNVLVDARAVPNRSSVSSTFELVSVVLPDEPDDTRTAAIEAPEHEGLGRFFENLMRNRGRIYRMFLDEAEALAWLLSDAD